MYTSLQPVHEQYLLYRDSRFYVLHPMGITNLRVERRQYVNFASLYFYKNSYVQFLEKYLDAGLGPFFVDLTDFDDRTEAWQCWSKISSSTGNLFASPTAS